MNDERTTIFQAQAATMFTMGGFGATKTEVRSITIQTGKWAQYDKAFFVTFLEKRKHKAVCTVLSYNPFLLVTRADAALTPDDPMELVSDTPEAKVTRTRFASFDPAYKTEFVTKAKTFEAANPGAILFSIGFEEAKAVAQAA